MRTFVLALLLTFTSLSWAGIGVVSDAKGTACSIERAKQKLSGNKGESIESMDTYVTGSCSANITFKDDTKVKVTENSKLLIDDFVFDAKKSDAGKLAIKVAMGTVRYASGQVAKNNPQAVDIKTPTATVAVRGTDFSMTVDELGRSLITLLPSCDAKSCVTGAIEVITDAGVVFMDAPYQTTVVSSRSMPPSKPVIITIDQSNINNLLIVSPPKEVREEEKDKQQKTALDVNFLDVDLLKYNALDKDELKSFKELDINYLDVDFLVNLLDASTAALMASQEVLAEEKSLLPGYTEASGLKYYFNDDGSKVTLYKVANHTAYVTLNKESDVMVNITQDSVPLTQKVNKGGTTVINIIQQ